MRMVTQEKPRSRKEEFRHAAAEIEKELVPPNSTLDRELNSYINEWNWLLDKTAKANLTEDVNVYIRDYLRKILKTTHSNNLTTERIKKLSETLVHSPAMSKIKDTDALYMYIQLYMIKLLQ